MERFPVIHGGRAEVIQGQNMIILHGVLVAIVIIRSVMIQVMRRIDINFALEYMGRRVSCINVGHQRLLGLYTCHSSNAPLF
ncbi:hypothetical protein D3C73_1126590 [compost metagenome]